MLLATGSGISLSTSSDAGRGKVGYIWIFADLAKVGLTLEGVVLPCCYLLSVLFWIVILPTLCIKKKTRGCRDAWFALQSLPLVGLPEKNAQSWIIFLILHPVKVVFQNINKACWMTQLPYPNYTITLLLAMRTLYFLANLFLIMS